MTKSTDGRIPSPEEVLNEAHKLLIELGYLRNQAQARNWDNGGELQACSCIERTIVSINLLCEEVSRMNQCLRQIDEDASKWHHEISVSVARGAFPQQFNSY